jgi:hypothetical protein
VPEFEVPEAIHNFCDMKFSSRNRSDSENAILENMGMAKLTQREYLRKELALVCGQLEAGATFIGEELAKHPRLYTLREQNTLALTLGAMAAMIDPIVESIAARRNYSKPKAAK